MAHINCSYWRTLIINEQTTSNQATGPASTAPGPEADRPAQHADLPRCGRQSDTVGDRSCRGADSPRQRTAQVIGPRTPAAHHMQANDERTINVRLTPHTTGRCPVDRNLVVFVKTVGGRTFEERAGSIGWAPRTAPGHEGAEVAAYRPKRDCLGREIRSTHSLIGIDHQAGRVFRRKPTPPKD